MSKFRLTPIAVTTDEDWEMLRIIRNDCRHGFTQDQTEITKEQQFTYQTRALVNPSLRHYLYKFEGITVGFSRIESGRMTASPTIGVASWARSLGFGREIGAMVLLAAGLPCVGELWLKNERAKKVDFGLGWKEAGPALDGKQPIHCRWPPPSAEPTSEDPWITEWLRYHAY